MMKYVFAGVFALGAAVLAFFWFQPECGGGQIFTSEAECRRNLPAEFCMKAMLQAERKARLDYSPFPTQDDCLRQFPNCMPHGRVVGGYVPSPSGYCLGRDGDGKVAAAKPIYARIGQAINRQ